MNEETIANITTGGIVKPTPKRTSKPKPAKPPRTRKPIDPAEQAIKDAAKAQIEAYRQGLKSGKVLETAKKLAAKLTTAHRRELADYLQELARAHLSGLPTDSIGE